jgi:hypothetical protein
MLEGYGGFSRVPPSAQQRDSRRHGIRAFFIGRVASSDSIILGVTTRPLIIRSRSTYKAKVNSMTSRDGPQSSTRSQDEAHGTVTSKRRLIYPDGLCSQLYHLIIRRHQGNYRSRVCWHLRDCYPTICPLRCSLPLIAYSEHVRAELRPRTISSSQEQEIVMSLQAFLSRSESKS